MVKVGLKMSETIVKTENKFETDNPTCEKCGTPLDYCETEGVASWWECPNCGNIENRKPW